MSPVTLCFSMCLLPSEAAMVRAFGTGARRSPGTSMCASPAPTPPAAAEAPVWFVQVPSTFEALAQQACRSVVGAARQGGCRRVLVEASAPELDPASDAYRFQELIGFSHSLAIQLLEVGLPKSSPHVKLLFASAADATYAGASILTTSCPVSVLGHPAAIGPRDGAFVVVGPAATQRDQQPTARAEAALRDLLQRAGGRLVVVLNPRLGNSPVLAQGFETAYLMRPLSVGCNTRN